MTTAYHAKYFANELTKQCSSDSIEKFAGTLSEAQVDLNPHQIDAALFSFKSPFSKGAILADEVGLGKTIEAGIILSQKWAERKKKILIIMPSNLRKQWSQELADKFYLPSVILESKSFNKEIKNGNLNPFIQDKIVICSYHFARNKAEYINAINWDFVVIDEAHRLRNVYKKSNKIANAIKEALEGKNKILLTATPLQNSLLELYGLVSIIDEFTFGDIQSFKMQYCRISEEQTYSELKSRLKPICQRTLRRQILEYIKYTNRIAITQEFIPTEEEQRLYYLVSEYLQRPNLYALPASQRKLMTLILRKLLASSTYAISGTLGALVDKLQDIIDNHKFKNETEDEIAEDFEPYDELKDEWADEEECEQESQELKVYTKEEIAEIQAELDSLKEFYNLSKSIEKNSKGEVLLKALEKGFAKAEELGGNRKALIFTESTRTQEYLKNILEKTTHAGKIVLFNGSNNDDKSKEIYKNWLEKHKGTDIISGSKTADIRASIVEYFRDEAEILIATEAAAEGINLQFCSLLLNYDLPWNPQRIEQRIGRCHRYGQKHDVVVVNFLNKKNAADQRVYELLAQKFKIFDGVFGASDEVLGAIGSGMDFEKRIAQIYQSCRSEEEINQYFDDLQKDMEAEIDEQMLQTRKKLLENFDEEVAEKLRLSKSKANEYLDKYENWLWDITNYYLKDYAEFNYDEKYFMLNTNPFPQENISRGPYRLGKNIEDANTYRIGHFLAQRILENCKEKELPVKEIIFDYTGTKDKKISIIEDLVGQSGWIYLQKLTIDSFESEDYLLFAGYTDNSIRLEPEQCRRIFSLPATESSNVNESANEEMIKDILHAQQVDLIEYNAQKNAKFFDEEMEKLDKWAEDIKNSLELELKQLDKDIKTKKTESKKILKLEEKVLAQRQIKEMEKKRNRMRMDLYKMQDEAEEKKEKLIEEIEARLKQQIKEEELFLIRWSLI